MFRNFVPRKLQPWLYIFIAVTFQLSGGLYMANLSHMVGETSLMREDLQMCLYCNLAGMAVYFPLLFRMKFRFTNKTLLTAASLGVIVCNLIAPCRYSGRFASSKASAKFRELSSACRTSSCG